MDYRATLKTKGIKPLPPLDKLRTTKRPGDMVQMPGGKFVRYGEAA